MSETAVSKPSTAGKILKTEFMLLVGLLFVGLVLLPIAVWFVGSVVFGAYEGAGYMGFFATLSGKIRNGDLAAWFLVLSPWLVVQCVRLMVLAWQKSKKT